MNKTLLIIATLCRIFITPEGVCAQDQVNAFGEFVSTETEQTLNRCWSSNGQYWCELQFSAAGFGHFQVSELTLYNNRTPCAKIINPPGTGFYISNTGLIAAISTSEALTAEGTLAFYDANGDLLFKMDVRGACDFVFSHSGNIFAFQKSTGVTVVRPVTGERISLKPAEIFALGHDDGRIALYSGNQLTCCENSTPVFEKKVKIKWPRKIAFSADDACLAIIGKNRLLVIAREKQQILYSKETAAKQSFRDVKWDGHNLKVGIAGHEKNSFQGSFQIFNLEGRELYSSEPVRTWIAPDSTPSQSLLKSGQTIPWPMQPFNQAIPLGNSYEEYQDYGFRQYLHPGIDMMTPANTSVYSVAHGYVKTILTTDGQWHYRIAVGDSADSSCTDAWLYAHLVQSSIPWEIGDEVQQFDFLGRVVLWPDPVFCHLHFVQIRRSGLEWKQYSDWDTISNPLIVLQPHDDSSPPVFHTTISSDTFAFCKNESSEYLKPDSLYGDIDIIAQVGDHIGHPNWECSIYRLEFDLACPFTGRIVYGPFPSMTLDHLLFKYPPAECAHVLHKNDDICNSEGNYTERNFFMILTNSDGDSDLELTDADACLNTRTIPDGPYRVQVRASDAAGNMSRASMDVEIQNGNPRTFVYSIRHEGQMRSFLLHVPNQFSASQPVPLVVALHGGFGSGMNFERMSGLSDKADSAGFIVAYPNGLKSIAGIRTWNAGYCCGASARENIDDVGFIASLIQHVSAQYPIDTTRIYATGISNGGMMCYRLACELSDKIAAIAPVAATMVIDHVCSPARPVAVLHIHSALDQHVPYAGGYGSEAVSGQYNPPVDSVLTVWSALNGCPDVPDTVYQGYDFIHIIRHPCIYDADVELYLTLDGGHSWPGGKKFSAGSDGPSEVINANDVIWEFFLLHPMHGKPSQAFFHDDTPETFSFSCYPNPFNPTMNVHFTLPKKDNVALTLYDILGRQVDILLNEIQTAGSHDISYCPQHLSSGVYFCHLKTSEYDQIQKILYVR